MKKTTGQSAWDPVTRRSVLTGLGAAIGAATVGCGAGDEPGARSDALSPQELLAPIKTIVVLCMENRSFDHYFGSLSLKEGWPVDGLTGKEWNPDPTGKRVTPFQLDDFTPESPPHDWDPVHAQWDHGKNDGFVIAHAGPFQNEVMGYHVRAQLPVLYALADASAVCDRWFSSVLGPTWPNRFYLHGATSNGIKSNTPTTGFKSVFDLLNAAKISNVNYYHDVPWCSTSYFKSDGLATIETFFDDAKAGRLPAFSLIDPQFFGAGANDDHPDHDVQLGEVLIAAVYNALAQSRHWGECLLVITYDEHGGFFDHVPPPTTRGDDREFAQLGFRVPALVAGPFARRKAVVSTVFEHVSVIRTLQTRFQLPRLNARADAANDLSSCIDPELFGRPAPPIKLPAVEVSMSKLGAQGKRPISQPEMWDAAERGLVPRHLDRRGDLDAITRRVLDHAERLGAARLID